MSKTPSKKYLAGYRQGMHDGSKDGYNRGLYDGYNLGFSDSTAGLRAVWLKDKNGSYFIAEKHHHTDPDYAEVAGVNLEGETSKINLTPEQFTKFNATIHELLEQYGMQYPNRAGKFNASAYLLPPGTETTNWGTIDGYKLLITNQPVAFNHLISKTVILYFIDYDL